MIHEHGYSESGVDHAADRPGRPAEKPETGRDHPEPGQPEQELARLLVLVDQISVQHPLDEFLFVLAGFDGQPGRPGQHELEQDDCGPDPARRQLPAASQERQRRQGREQDGQADRKMDHGRMQRIG